MKERPIIFSGEMVRAILAGRKTQTRRVLKTQPIDVLPFDKPEHNQKWVGLMQREPSKGVVFRCSYGVPGDRLWVRETWDAIERGAPYLEYNHEPCGVYPIDPVQGCEILYRATDDDGLTAQGFKWRSPLFMPRWASRITLTITDVRVERVQDMPWEDVKREGIGAYTVSRGVLSDNPPDPRWAYIELWDSLNAKRGYSWASNPWVWVISYEVTQ